MDDPIGASVPIANEEGGVGNVTAERKMDTATTTSCIFNFVILLFALV